MVKLNDKDIANMRLGLATCPQFNDLVDVYSASLKHLRRLPGRYTRSLEYPWVLNRVRAVKNLKNAVDVGAGISPLPIILAQDGAKVFTFDYSEDIRSWTDRKNWNAWGYLNYTERYPNIISRNALFDAKTVGEPVDAVYSVSVLEHTPKSARLAVWKEAYAALRKGGRTVHSIDVKPKTDLVWNLSMGQVVEDKAVHGTVDDVCAELKAEGFRIVEREMLRDIPGSNVDVFFVVGEK